MTHRCTAFDIPVLTSVVDNEEVRAYNREAREVRFDGTGTPASPEVLSTYAQEPTIFAGLNLSNKRTRARAEALAALSPRETYSRTDLNRLCGQPNKETARIFRRLFVYLPVTLDKRNGVGVAYGLHPRAHAELQKLCTCK